jgi:hypothetical protein
MLQGTLVAQPALPGSSFEAPSGRLRTKVVDESLVAPTGEEPASGHMRGRLHGVRETPPHERKWCRMRISASFGGSGVGRIIHFRVFPRSVARAPFTVAEASVEVHPVQDGSASPSATDSDPTSSRLSSVATRS